MAHNEKLIPILNDIEDKEIEIAGGSVVGQVLSITNSLITYICNLTIGKKKYLEVQEEVLSIKQDAQNLKQQTLEFIDKDKEVLENILTAYKARKENPEKLETIYKESVSFCMQVTKKAMETLKLVERISKVGNRMLASDFKISCFYAFASVEASIVNIKINLDSLADENYKENIRKEYLEIYKEAESIKQPILKDYEV